MALVFLVFGCGVANGRQRLRNQIVKTADQADDDAADKPPRLRSVVPVHPVTDQGEYSRRTRKLQPDT